MFCRASIVNTRAETRIDFRSLEGGNVSVSWIKRVIYGTIYGNWLPYMLFTVKYCMNTESNCREGNVSVAFSILLDFQNWFNLQSCYKLRTKSWKSIISALRNDSIFLLWTVWNIKATETFLRTPSLNAIPCYKELNAGVCQSRGCRFRFEPLTVEVTFEDVH